MKVTEFRIVMPMTVDEYHVGQTFSVAKAALDETGGGEGIEVVSNRTFHDVELNGEIKNGMYTHKIYHISSKLPFLIRKLVPKDAQCIHEEAWNSFPYCKTILSNPGYMQEKFEIVVETMHLDDRGGTDNALGLDKAELKKRHVEILDITDDHNLHKTDYEAKHDPKLFHSELTGRGPIGQGWIDSAPEPVMCCYKLVTCNFKVYGLQTRVEKIIMKSESRIFTYFHRKIFCWIDLWHDLSLEQAQHYQEKINRDLEEARSTGDVKGISAGHEHHPKKTSNHDESDDVDPVKA